MEKEGREFASAVTPSSSDMDDFASSRTTPAAGMDAHHQPTADQIYREHAPLLRRVAIRRFQVPRTDVDTLVHDVFIAYLARPETVRSNLRGYLIGSICNASRNYWRDRRTEHRVFTPDLPPDEIIIDTKDLVEGLAENQIAAEVLGRLEPRCRDVLKRYYMDGDKTSAIADALGTSCGNVNYLMHVCRKNARALYDRIMRVERCR